MSDIPPFQRRKSRSGTRSMSEKKTHAPLQIPRQKAYFENGSPEAEPAVCRKKTHMPRYKFHANVQASIPSAPHSCRATCPASEPPACQARAKVGILPRKKMSRLPL